ncbi:MAG: S8 family peptidase [Muribaculaceae bacterium]
MKKFLLLLAMAFAVLPAEAQAKLDLRSMAQLRAKRLEMSKSSDSKFNQQMKVLKSAYGVPSNYMLAVIRLSDGYTEEDLEAEGVTVLRCSYGFAFVAVPVEQVEKVSQMKSVRCMQLARPVSNKMKNARAMTGVDKVHQGLGLPQAYTGKNVVSGIVDAGLDPNHINFMDADGNPRINFLAYLKVNENATSIDDVTDPKFYDSSNISKFSTDDKTSYHGTHTLGIMAGGYRGELNVAEANTTTGLADISSMANPYYGVAYESDIAAACGDLMDLIIAMGVDYILQYAAEEAKKPCVINLSLGSNTGAHDGTGVINQFFDECAKRDNAIICVSAGNEGDMNIACNKTFTSTDTELKTFIEGYNAEFSTGTAYARAGSTEIYSNDNTPFTEIKCVIYNTARGKIARNFSMTIDETTEGTGKYWVSSADYQEASTDMIDEILGRYFSGFIGLGWSYDEYSNRFYAIVDYTLINTEANADGQYKVGFIVNGVEGQRIDAYSDGTFSYFSNNGIEDWDDGMNNGSISDLATGNSLIVVGSYNSSSLWGALDGNVYHSSYNTPVNEVTTFSSYGTLVDGRNLPHVLAPGAVIISSMNHYYETAGYADVAATSAQVPETTRKDSYGWAMGTSMASPHVAGAIAMWLEADPTLTVDDVRDIIAKTAYKDEYTALEPDQVKVGAGKFDAYEGLKEVLLRKESGIGSINADDTKLVIAQDGERSFKVFLADAKNMTTSVYNTMGARVMYQSVEGNEDTINVDGLTPGCYIVNVNGRYSKCIVVK